jgi:hypothetical protein
MKLAVVSIFKRRRTYTADPGIAMALTFLGIGGSSFSLNSCSDSTPLAALNFFLRGHQRATLQTC